MRIELRKSDWRIFTWVFAVLVAAFLFRLLSSTLLPFIAGLVLAYLLNPLASRLERLGLNRLGASLTILLLFVFALLFAIVLVAPPLARQLFGFAKSLPDYLTKLQSLAMQAVDALGERYGGAWLTRLGLGGGGEQAAAPQSITDLAGQGASALSLIVQSLWNGGAALVGLVSIFFVTPVVAFYILLDWALLVEALDGLIPLGHRATVHALAREIDAAMAGFLRGQSLVCLFLGLWYAIGLSLVGLNFGLLIGLSGGLLTFVPYVGSLTVLVAGVGVALAQSWPGWTLPLLVLGVVGLGQFIEANFLTPRLVGASVGLHPVWLIFALLAFGSLMGFSGLLIAVPVAAAAGVLLRFAVRQYRQSSLYLGSEATTPTHVDLTG